MATNPDQFQEIVGLLRPIINYGVVLGFIYVLTLMTGKSPLELSEKFFAQFVKLAQGEKSLKSLNALIELLAFALIVILFASPFRDFVMPEMTGNETSSHALVLQGIIAFLIVTFLAAGIACIWFCGAERG